MYAVVTTEYRGVFAGEVDDDVSLNGVVVVKDARMCVYWSQAVRGVLGLASTGPDAACRITQAVPEIRLRKVTSVTRMTDEALTAWRREPWG